MKPCNFPARKLARQIGARVGLSVNYLNKLEVAPSDVLMLEKARNIRSKKSRG